MLSGSKYKDLPVDVGMRKYAPKLDNNDPEKYTATLGKMGLDPKGKIGDQVDKMMGGIQQVEGFKGPENVKLDWFHMP